MQLLGIILAAAGVVLVLLYRPRTKAALSETRALGLLGTALVLMVAGIYLFTK
jgi:hypothetical protein